jgi:holo-[acyl-carrier protein] synthase
MIIGIGLDLVDLRRFAAFRARWQGRGMERLFTAAELEDCMARVDPVPSLAARFAAKEAFFKALGTGFGRGGAWTDVEVRRREMGAPALSLSGRARMLAGRRGVTRIHVSLTHSASAAGAEVVLEGDGRPDAA